MTALGPMTPLDMALESLSTALYWLEEYDRTRDADAFDMALENLSKANAKLDAIAGAIE